MRRSITPILTEASSATAETLVGDERAPRSAGAKLGRGAMLGRYIVLDTLGRGGMGIVHSAYDPELDRKVALKLLLPGRDRGAAARLRLQREAQAIARLSHPNVVAVHDVGTADDQVFIAMELVDGTDLVRWLESEPRSQAARLDCFMQAGAGLVAAHAAELVHRDFKPENVLMGRDGRARVVDFGLVRKDETGSPSGVSVDELPQEVSHRLVARSQDLQLTAAGSMVGTPAYMSPEQWKGQPGDARSDQFSFCVSLYEALYGERPFEGDNPAELSYAVCKGELRAPPGQHEVSGRVRRVLVRGLAVDPRARYPSMEALLDALRKAVAPRRRWWLAGGLALLAGGGLGLLAFVTHTRAQACAHMTDRASLMWSPERRAGLKQAFERTALSYAADTWSRVDAHVDAHVAEWTALQAEVCEANQGLDPAVATDDPQQRCLDEHLEELDELLAVLDGVDAPMVTRAVPLTYGLGALDECTTVEIGGATPSPSDPALRAQVDEIRAEIRRIELHAMAGVDDRDAKQVTALAERAELLGYGPLLAEVQELRASQADHQGDFDEALTLENLAFETSLANRHDRQAFETAVDLAFLLGVKRREPIEGHRWARRAEALRQRMGNDERQRMRLLSNWASIYALEGNDEQALALYEEALTLVRNLDEPLVLPTLLNNIGAFHAERRRLDRALEYLEEAAVRQEDLLGPDHPSTLRTRANLGVIAVMEGRSEAGREMLEAVLPRQEAALGLEHPEIGVTLEGLASALTRLGELEKAETARRRVLEIRMKVHGPHSRPVLMAQGNLDGLLIVAGRHAEAYASATKMLDELDANTDVDPRIRLQVLDNLATAALQVDPKEALRYADEGRALCRTLSCLPSDELNLVLATGRAKEELGDRQGARAAFDEVLLGPKTPFHPWYRIQARFGQARTMLEVDREAALAVARRALEEGQAEVDAESKDTVREIEAWLREHG